jgi:tRNA A-37 threonylcarbamoyl transferase component Bud32
MEDWDNIVGRVLGETYRVSRLVGKGGMGAVFEAQNIRLGKRVAVKMLSRKGLDHDEAGARFRREARIACDLSHPHIVDVIDFNVTEDGLAYMIMEYLEGQGLDALLGSSPRLPVERALFILSQVCAALQAAHRGGVIHRDLKPSNIFLCENQVHADFVKVLDFGIAKIPGSSTVDTGTGALIGSPQYMAPEQADHLIGEVGPWTDVFAVGSIAYLMLAGRLPFDAKSVPGVLYQLVNSEPQPLESLRDDLPAELTAVVRDALVKTPAERIGDMAELGRRLEQVGGAAVATAPAPVSVDTVVSQAAEHGGAAGKAGSRRALYLSFAAVLIICGASLLWWLPFGAAPTAGPDSGVSADLACPPDHGRPDTGVRAPDAGQETPPTLTIEAVPPSARIFVDGAPSGRGKVVLPRVDRPRRVQVRAPGHLPRTVEVPARASGVRTIRPGVRRSPAVKAKGLRDIPPNPYKEIP